MYQLTIDGVPTALSAAFTLRFVELPDGGAAPVLYRHGRRVIRRWSLQLDHEQPEDRWGISGGKDEPCLP